LVNKDYHIVFFVVVVVVYLRAAPRCSNISSSQSAATSQIAKRF